MENNYSILCYTRKPQEDIIYSAKLAYSMHLAYSLDGKEYKALNHNSGVLFAKATDNEDKTMNAKSLKNPYLFRLKDGSFGVVAIRCQAFGEDDGDGKGKVLLFTSSDLIQYNEIGLIDLLNDSLVKAVTCEYDSDKDAYVLSWCDQAGSCYSNDIIDLYDLECKTKAINIEAVNITGPNIDELDIEGIVAGNVISVSERIGKQLSQRLSTPYNVSIEVPKKITAASLDILNDTKAKGVYSDGSSAYKSIAWDVEDVKWDHPGEYDITGTIHQDHYDFPFATNRADPCISKWKDKYYFIATNDADSNHTLYIREADTIPQLLNAKEELILDSITYDDIGGLLWAPELHVVDDELYIFHAATPGEFFHEECHVMALRKGGNPTCKDDWSRPMRVIKKDGSYLCEAGKTISLDMTCFKWNDDYYVSWSERQFLPVDIGAWLYIAKIDSKEPWKLITDPVLLSKPDYGWANNHTFVDEGPFALIRDGRIFLTFSSAAVDATYVVSYLTAKSGADLLNLDNWTKCNYPILSSRSVEGEYGPGHNSYVIDDEGNVWNAYHARPGVEGPRSSGLRRVHFDIYGYPVLDLTENMDVNPELKQVKAKLVIPS